MTTEVTVRRAAVLGGLGALILAALVVAATTAIGPSSPRVDVATRAPSNGPRPVPTSTPASSTSSTLSLDTIEGWRRAHVAQLRRIVDDQWSAEGASPRGAYEAARRDCADLDAAVGTFRPTTADPGPPAEVAGAFGAAMALYAHAAGECEDNTTNAGAWLGDMDAAYQDLRSVGLSVVPDAWASQ